MNEGETMLAPLRVLDLAGADGDGVTRLFADLGADVLKIEPPGGSPARGELPAVAGAGIPFALRNANKRSAVLDPAMDADRERFLDLAATADIVVDSGNPGRAAAFGTSCAELAERFSHLVALSVTDFGADGPYASWRATDPVFYAMSTALSRSGPTSGTPVLPPERHRVGHRRGAGRHGRHSSLTTTGYVAAEAITSTSPGSRRWCSRWIRRSGRRDRPP